MLTVDYFQIMLTVECAASLWFVDVANVFLKVSIRIKSLNCDLKELEKLLAVIEIKGAMPL